MWSWIFSAIDWYMPWLAWKHREQSTGVSGIDGSTFLPTSAVNRTTARSTTRPTSIQLQSPDHEPNPSSYRTKGRLLFDNGSLILSRQLFGFVVDEYQEHVLVPIVHKWGDPLHRSLSACLTQSNMTSSYHTQSRLQETRRRLFSSKWIAKYYRTYPQGMPFLVFLIHTYIHPYFAYTVSTYGSTVSCTTTM